ncbi:osteopontin isoform X2 [Pogoniulus pusillus]|uniref:osteopontin isoform X2 n=1 Tax=Pogoniulus pusillus TaxID=488313 RepID=UPI0030B936B2
MKGALLCFCLISIAAAWPVSKSKQQATSAASEEKYDLKGHRSHRYHNLHVKSQSWEDDLVAPQQRSPDASSQSREAVEEDDHDDNDSNDTDESDEVVTVSSTDLPLTFPPFTRDKNAGRGDSVVYRLRAKAKPVKSSKLHKAAPKLVRYDVTTEDDSAPDADSQQDFHSREAPAVPLSLRKEAFNQEWADKSHGQGSSEPDSKQRERSVENDSWQEGDSQEAADDSRAGARGDSQQSRESRAEPLDNTSNQTVESAEDARDRHSIESNEVTL